MVISNRLLKVSTGDRAAVLMEHAMLVTLVAIAAIATLTAFGVSVLELYTSNDAQFDAAVRASLD